MAAGAVRVLTIAGTAGVVVLGAVLYVRFGAFLPWREDAEAIRLGDLAGVKPGSAVAEIGAGSGRFTYAMARRVGSQGKVLATELDTRQLKALQAGARERRLEHVTVVESAPSRTMLPAGCCDVVFMRNVFHHVADRRAFARDVVDAVAVGGRIVIIDFEPRALWWHADIDEGGHGLSRREAIDVFTAAGAALELERPRWSGPMWLVMLRRRAG